MENLSQIKERLAWIDEEMTNLNSYLTECETKEDHDALQKSLSEYEEEMNQLKELEGLYALDELIPVVEIIFSPLDFELNHRQMQVVVSKDVFKEAILKTQESFCRDYGTNQNIYFGRQSPSAWQKMWEGMGNSERVVLIENYLEYERVCYDMWVSIDQ